MKIHHPALILLVILTYSCGQNKKPSSEDQRLKDKEKLSQYFTAATSGFISSMEPLTYVFNVPVSEVPGDKDLQKLIQISPSVKGTVSLTGNTILKFTPEDSWENGKTYQVTLDLKSLGPIYKDKIEYSVEIVPQEISVSPRAFDIHDDKSITLSLSVMTADKADLKKMQSVFSTDAQHMEVIRESDFEYIARFHYPDALRSSNYIRFDGTKTGAPNKGEISLSDFISGEFQPLSSYHDIKNGVFYIYFSEILDPYQDLFGMIQLNGQTVSVTRKNNRLTMSLASADKTKPNTLTLQSGILSESSRKSTRQYTYPIHQISEKPDVQFLHDGHYFPSEGDFRIPIKTQLLKEVHIMVVEIKQENARHFMAWQSLNETDFYNVRMYGRPVYNETVSVRNGLADQNGWKIYGLDLSDKIQKNPGSLYFISLDFGAGQTTLPCAESLRGFDDETQLPDEKYFDDKNSYYYRSYFPGFKWEERNNPCTREFYVDKPAVSRLFLCSDYGVMVKKGGDKYHTFLWELTDLSPVKDADVTFYNLQGEPVGSGVSDTDGQFVYTSNKHVPAIVQINKSRKITYLSLDNNESNSITEFDTEGQKSSLDTEFFTYTDRGIYRPGDTVFVSLMINKWQSSIPPGMPVTARFYNPDNTLLQEQFAPINIQSQLLYGFRFYTHSQAKTGPYRLVLEAGEKKIVRTIRVETIKPNVAESTISYDQLVGQKIFGPSLSGTYVLNYLTGLPVANAKVQAKGRIHKIARPFDKFSQFSFDKQETGDKNITVDLFQLTTDAQGQGEISNKLDFSLYNHPVRLSVEVDVLLPGGGTVKEGSSVQIYPLKSYVGIKNPGGNGWWGAYSVQDDIRLDIVHLNEGGQSIKQSRKLSYQLFRNTSSWWMDSYYYGSRGHYNDSQSWQETEEGQIFVKGKGDLTFPAGQLSAGEYKARVSDPLSGHQSEVSFIIWDVASSGKRIQPHLAHIETDKTSYTLSENIKIKIPDIPEGRVLISVESGQNMIEQKWYDISESGGTVSLKPDEKWPGHVYIHATIIQPYMQDNNDLPLRMYGIVPLEIRSKKTPLKPVAGIPRTLESNKSYTFEVREADGRPMEYTLALIDEGLLNLSGHKTPDPKEHFSGKLPLLVKTWDIYKYLMNFFKGKFAGIISIGGDDAYRPDAIPELSRYSPVVICQGPFKIGTKGSQKHSITIPNYIGKLRLMIVACSEDNYGHMEDDILVRNPLMLQSQFPRSLNVTDQVYVPVQLIKNEPSIQKVTLSALSTPVLADGLEKNQTLSFGSQKQIQAGFALKVRNTPGKSRIQLKATSGKYLMTEETEIAVNYPHSYSSAIDRQRIEPGESYTFKTRPRGYLQQYDSYLTVTGIKAPNFISYAQELISYPYGCLEQTASAGMSQLFLDKLTTLSGTENQKRLQHLENAVQKIASLQNKSGSFNYWDNDYYDTWSDIYAGDFMVEAHHADYLNDKKPVLDKWLKRQTSLANNWSLNPSSDSYNRKKEMFFQAYRLYILAKSGQPAKSALNRFVTTVSTGESMVFWFIAGAYAYSGYHTKAQEYISRAESAAKSENEDTSDFYNYSLGSTARDKSIKVDILSRTGNKKAMELYYSDLVDDLNEMSWVSTQTKGYAFLAMYKYYGGKVVSSSGVAYNLSGIKLKESTFNHSAGHTEKIPLPENGKTQTLQITNTGKGPLFVHLTEKFMDDNLTPKETSEGIQLEVTYHNASSGKSDIAKIKAGDEILVSVLVKNLLPVEIKHMALIVKMPSGLELINPRLYTTEHLDLSHNVDYQDFKDDRVYTFFHIKGQGQLLVSFKARAAYTGDFYWPSISCENMYRGDIYARTKARRVQVE